MIGDRGDRARWRSNEPGPLAGRCLLDLIEYLRTDTKLPARFRQLIDAHVLRLVIQCLMDLGNQALIERVKPQIRATCESIMNTRNTDPPFFGDDFWDWAYILEALVVVNNHDPKICKAEYVKQEMNSFYTEVQARIDKGLTYGGDGEWFGPAVPTAVYRVLSHCSNQGDFTLPNVDGVLTKLKQQATKMIQDGKFLGKPSAPGYSVWHYGQVVHQFPDDTSQQTRQIADFPTNANAMEKKDRAFALARVIQGLHARKDDPGVRAALDQLYKCQTASRPFGDGLIGDCVKASANVFEALWPLCSTEDRQIVSSMLDALVEWHVEQNTIGILVAIDREAEACRSAFCARGASIENNGDTMIARHASYRVVIVQGKSIMGAGQATQKLIELSPAWLLMVGIAGSLGRTQEGEEHFTGPKHRDLVVSTSVAPFRIRDKVRDEVENAGVPLGKLEWKAVPTDPTLFDFAHRAQRELVHQELAKEDTIHEGLIVTGTGIMDDRVAKAEVLKEWPGGLAIEEEGYIFALLCMRNRMPCIVIRGISDLAEGDKKEDNEQERPHQEAAAKNAADLAVRIVELLSAEL